MLCIHFRRSSSYLVGGLSRRQAMVWTCAVSSRHVLNEAWWRLLFLLPLEAPRCCSWGRVTLGHWMWRQQRRVATLPAGGKESRGGADAGHHCPGTAALHAVFCLPRGAGGCCLWSGLFHPARGMCFSFSVKDFPNCYFNLPVLLEIISRWNSLRQSDGKLEFSRQCHPACLLFYIQWRQG